MRFKLRILVYIGLGGSGLPLCAGRALGGDDEFSPGWNNIIQLLRYAVQLRRLCNAISTVFRQQILLHRGGKAVALIQKDFGITQAKIAWIISDYKCL